MHVRFLLQSLSIAVCATVAKMDELAQRYLSIMRYTDAMAQKLTSITKTFDQGFGPGLEPAGMPATHPLSTNATHPLGGCHYKL